MPKKKIQSKEIEEKILEILDSKRISLSVSQVTKILREEFNISISPQVTKRYLLKLHSQDKIIQE